MPMRDTHETLAPSPWIARFAPLIARGARVLDLAAGGGRHARFLADRGANVLALDRDASALAALEGIPRTAVRVADLEDGSPWPLTGERFDAIVVVNYLHRPLFDAIAASLVPDGVLLYETFARGNATYGRPARPEFLLEPGELLALAHAHGLVVVAFEQGLVEGPSRRAVVQRLAAVGAARAWPPMLPGDPRLSPA